MEQRTVPAILFPKTDSATVVDHGGPVIDHADVELIFWGAGWNSGSGPTLRNNLTAAADRIVSGPYLTLLSQYRPTIGPGTLVDAVTITSSNPPNPFSDAQMQSILQTNINNGTLPHPSTDSQLLYMVIPQPGTNGPSGVGGEHNSAMNGGTRFHYGWTINNGSVGNITTIFSHELAEAVSDPEVNVRTALTTNGPNELADGPAQNFSYSVNGDTVQSILDRQHNAYGIANGTAQDFSIDANHVLHINGDQLADPNDTITLELSGTTTKVTINGEVALFPTSGGFGVTSIVINSGSGDDTINIDQTSAARPITINLGDGTDTVNLAGAGGNLDKILGAVTVNGGGGTATLNLFDQANPVVKAYRLTDTTLTRAGMATVTYNSISNLAVNLGSAANNTFTVVGAGAAATTVTGSGSGGTLVGPDATASWEITGPDAGVLTADSLGGPVTFAGVVSLKGGAGDNTFVFDDGQGIDGQILGGGGSNTLDYAAYTSTVLVNLQTGQATGAAGGVGNIQNVLGGNGGGSGVYNILVGAGGNVLTGGAGRTNLLIAGGSASTLIGGDSGDILIGGTTAYDQEADMASLTALMDYWSTTGDDYATRVANLLSGNGVPLLDATTVTNNGGGNTMYGNAGGAFSLFYGLDPSLETTDYNPATGEQFITV